MPPKFSLIGSQFSTPAKGQPKPPAIRSAQLKGSDTPGVSRGRKSLPGPPLRAPEIEEELDNDYSFLDNIHSLTGGDIPEMTDENMHMFDNYGNYVHDEGFDSCSDRSDECSLVRLVDRGDDGESEQSGLVDSDCD